MSTLQATSCDKHQVSQEHNLIDEEFILMKEALTAREEKYREDDQKIIQAYFYAEEIFKAMQKLDIKAFHQDELVEAARQLGIEYNSDYDYKIVKFTSQNISFKGDTKKTIKARKKIIKKYKIEEETELLCAVHIKDRTHIISYLEKYPYEKTVFMPVDIKSWQLAFMYGEIKHKACLDFMEQLPLLMRIISDKASEAKD